MAAKKAVVPSGVMKKYTMYLSDKRMRQVTVPAEWRVTFGPLVPQPQERGNYERLKTFALRFYESKEQQRACFTDVMSFYVEDITPEYSKNPSP